MGPFDQLDITDHYDSSFEEVDDDVFNTPELLDRLPVHGAKKAIPGVVDLIANGPVDGVPVKQPAEIEKLPSKQLVSEHDAAAIKTLEGFAHLDDKLSHWSMEKTDSGVKLTDANHKVYNVKTNGDGKSPEITSATITGADGKTRQMIERVFTPGPERDPGHLIYIYSDAQGDHPIHIKSATLRKSAVNPGIDMVSEDGKTLIKLNADGSRVDIDTDLKKPNMVIDANGNKFEYEWKNEKMRCPSYVSMQGPITGGKLHEFKYDDKSLFASKSEPYRVYVGGDEQPSTLCLGAGVTAGNGAESVGIGVAMPLQERVGLVVYPDGSLSMSQTGKTLEGRLEGSRKVAHLYTDGGSSLLTSTGYQTVTTDVVRLARNGEKLQRETFTKKY